MWQSRTELLIGKDNIENLANKHIAIFGLGGVGGFALEALARAGIEEFTIIDFDIIDITNINRQIIATLDTVGEKKVDIFEKRLKSINKNIKVHAIAEKFCYENKDLFFENKNYDYIVDAIDIISSKLDLIELAKKKNIKIISAMGGGNKLNPTMFEVSDIYKTSVCPLAKVVRRELKKRNIKDLKVVYSKENPRKPKNEDGGREKSKNVGSISFVPSTIGLIIASEIVKDICRL